MCFEVGLIAQGGSDKAGIGVAPDRRGKARCDSGARCGDGLMQGDEVCDDGNTVAYDGCDNACMLTIVI